jgi:hypothetical protein
MLKHFFLVLWSAIRQVFDLMPDFVALFLTALGIGAVAMGEDIKKLDHHPHWRRGIIVACIVFGALAFISNQIQKGEDKADQVSLRGQIKILVDNSTTQATSADIRGLADAISVGFQRVETAIGGQHAAPSPHPSKPPTPAPSPAPQGIRFTQKRVPSTDPDNNPFALQVIVQTDASITPVGLKFTFTGPISKINFFIAGQTAMMMVQYFVVQEDPKIGVIRVGYPALSADSPMVVTILSKENVSLVSVDKISAAMNGPIQ